MCSQTPKPTAVKQYVDQITSQLDIRYSNIKHPSYDHHRWIFDIRMSNIHLTSSQVDIRYSNIRHPSDNLPDGYLIFEYRISTCELVRWVFDIRISNIHLTTSQMDIQYSDIKRPLTSSQMDI